MDQLWFEMQQYRKRSLDVAAWIPLYAVDTIERQGSYGYVGYREDFFGCGSVAVPIAQRELAEQLGWSELGIDGHHRGWIDDGTYVSADVFKASYPVEVGGINLVMIQDNIGKLQGDWLVHPDLILTLGLYQENDVWVCPSEGYVEVIRVTRNNEGKKAKIEIRSEQLKDYLCARQLGLWVTWYRERDEIQEDVSYLTWPELNSIVESPHLRWEGRVIEIHEGGEMFGSNASIFHFTRTNVDFEEDVPLIGLPTAEDDTASSTITKEFHGRKLYRVLGEVWREEWVSPGSISPRIRKDEIPVKPTFIVDAAGSREDESILQGGGRWLWFKPEVAHALLTQRDGALGWHTATTGSVGADAGSCVAFGINALGLLNVYGKDIAHLPHWQQLIWAGFNVSPDGKVSKELLSAQAVGRPSSTIAPEDYLETAFIRLNEAIMSSYGVVAFRPHADTQNILLKCHRFRAITFDGLLELAKDLARLSADSIDKAQLQTKLIIPKGENWGSLKSLEKLVALKVGEVTAREISGPLFGVYDLRLADAHLPSTTYKDALKLVGVDIKAPGVIQGHMMLHKFVSALVGMEEAIRGTR